jgi:hypothetical protein
LLGGGLGALGTYLAVPESLSLGMSSYVITATMAGAIFGGALGVGIEGGDAGLTLGAGAGLAVGGGLGGLTARRLRPSVGDAAILNSGVVWGSVTGALFSVVFDGSRRLDGAMVLGGLGTGALAGALLGRSYEASRRHVMLVDLAGLGGAVAASALQSVLVDGSATTDESRAHYALAGLGVGLLAGALLTRNVDDPRLAPRGAVPQAARVSPSVAPVASMADGRGGGLTFGVVGAL